jgi:hypothetical protein
VSGAYLTSECADPRCDRQVITVRLEPKLVPTPVDPEPVDWADGGSVRIRGGQDGSDEPVGYRVVSAAAAFGARGLRQPHAQTCKGKQKHARQRAKSS